MPEAKNDRLLSFKSLDGGGLALRLRNQAGREVDLTFSPDDTLRLLLAVTGALHKREQSAGMIVEGLSLEGFANQPPLLHVQVRNGGRLPLSLSPPIVETLIGMLETMLGRAEPPSPPKRTRTH